MNDVLRRFPLTAVALMLATCVALAATFANINVFKLSADVAIDSGEGEEILLAFLLIIPALLADRVAANRRNASVQLQSARAKSREAASRLAAIVESSDDAMLSKDLTGIITTWNAGAERLFGYSAAEIVGTSVTRIIPADREAEEARILESIRSGVGVKCLETVRRTKDGRLVEVSITSSPVRDESGVIVGASKVARDMTEQRESEKAQKASEARYRTLFDYAPDGILIVGRDGHYIDVNVSLCRMLGYTRGELIGKHSSEVVAPEEVRNIGSTWKALADRSSFQREWQLRRKDGSIFPADILSTLMPDGNLVAIVRDVTERNRGIEALRTAEERMRFALQNADVGIWDMDYTTGQLQWSDTLEAHYGLAPGSFAGTFDAFIVCVHPDDRPALLDTVGKAMETGTDFSTLHRAVWPDGTVHWLSGSGRVLLGEHGEPLRGVGISLDVTARRTLEEQFHQSQKMEAIGRLAGGVAHDFNNLLTAIIGYSQLVLADADLQDRFRADISEIEKAGNRAAGLTRQLLAFSRKQIIEPTLFDLNVVVTEMRSMIGRLIGEDVKTVVTQSPEPVFVKADRGQVEQVILNLAVNARDAMPLGGLLTIETTNVELDENYSTSHFAVKPGLYAELIVTDTGTGMTPEVQARLFEPFFTTKEAGKGTGLGLATVHGIVMRSGGNVGVYSELGRGTSFKVYLPRADSADAVAEAPRAPLQPIRPQTVLVVEDADGLRVLAKRLLERQGHTVLLAANAKEAVEVFERGDHIDVLLTDVVMPGASGPELTRQLVARQPSLKVIYMSGYTEDAIVQHGVLQPGLAFINKPFTADTLARKIQEVVTRPS